MDGNGRWAQKRLLPRKAGHVKGASMVRQLVMSCLKKGISCISIFAFSTENWGRPNEEISALMALFCLSFPNLWLKVPRHNKITAMYLDNTGKQCIIELEGIDARCFQHELDHLNGVCFTDGISKLKLDIALRKQRKLNGRAK